MIRIRFFGPRELNQKVFSGEQYYRRTHGPVYTVGSDDPDRIEETNEELIKMLNEDEMCDAVVMVFCQEAEVAWCDDGG